MIVTACRSRLVAPLESLIPFAASYEMIPQHRSELTLIGPISDMQFDQLNGAGCVNKIQAAWVGNAAVGLGHNCRRAAELAEPVTLEIEEHSNFCHRLGASGRGHGSALFTEGVDQGQRYRQRAALRSCPLPVYR